jgi:hypothetical protein
MKLHSIIKPVGVELMALNNNTLKTGLLHGADDKADMFPPAIQGPTTHGGT